MLEDLVARYGYLAIAVGTFLEGEAMLVIGAAMAHRGLLSLPWVALSALVGSVASDQMWFVIGHRAGRPFIAARPRLARHVAVVERWIARWGTLYVLSFRFLYGLRTLSPIVLGASGYPHARYVVLNVLGGIAWAAAFSAAGYGFGAALAALLGRHSRLGEAALVGLALAVLVALIRRRREEAVLPARETPPAGPST